ncbi:MAG: TonB-dependent receptor [Alteromonadaceae bacterium]|nr:TonB-dependent receptor [Alteromonadaceae bacterium]
MSDFKQKTTLLAMMSVMSAMTIPLTAFAQDTEQDNNAEPLVEKITVTTSRRVQTIQDVPASVTAIQPGDFLASGINSIADIIDYTAGFNINRSGGQRGRGSITARGVSQQGATAVTAIYVDDVPMTSNSGFADGGALFFDGLLGDVQRIELIKGPQGTLFGATAISGAVRYISRDPALFETRGSVTADYSHIEDGGNSKQYRGYVSVPLIDDKLGLTLSGFKADDAGYVDQVDPATGEVVKKNANDSDNYGYSADLLFEASADLSFRVKAIKQKTSFGLDASVRLASLEKEEVYGKLTTDNSFGSDEMETEMFSASMTYELDFATLDATTSKVEYNNVSAIDFTSIYGPFLDMLTGNPVGTTTSAPVTYDIWSDKNVSEIRLTSKNNDQYEWIAGLYHAEESTDNQQSLIGQPLNIVGLIASFPSEYDETAAFGNFTYYLTKDFDVTAGMRYAKTELALRFIQEGLLVGGEPSDKQLDTAQGDITTYLFAARYRPHADMSLYARIASGYRPASSNLTVADPATGEILSQPVTEQDDLWSYEVGAKGDFFDGMFSYDTSLWYIDWDNFQTTVYFYGQGTDGNAKDGITAYGTEGSFVFNAGNGFTLNTSVAYSRSTLNSDEPELFGEKGAAIPGVPKWRASAIGRYEFELSSGIEAWVTAGLRYTDSSDGALVNGDPSNPLFNLPSDTITQVDLSAGMSWNELTVTAYLNNAFNKYAYSNYTALSLDGVNADVVGVPLKPRTLGATITYAF